MMKILAIDPGTFCGYADNYADPGVGVWHLKPKKLEGKGMRYLKLRRYLEQVSPEPDLVVFEEVRMHRGTIAAHVYGGIVATIMAHCEQREIDYVDVFIYTWKKVVVGKGNVDKQKVLDYVRANIKSDCDSFDEADALCILQWAEHEYGIDMFG